MSLLLIYTSIFCSLWVFIFIAFAWTLTKVPLFQDETKRQKKELNGWPRISVIVPACNEAENIETALQSLLAQDYPNLEIITINDRSTDDTGTILDRLAAKDSRIRVIHLQELPNGWLGKVNAMHQGVKQASGEWYLFTDADIHFSPGLLKRAIIFMQQRKYYNHLALMPEITLRNFWLEVCIISFGVMFLFSSRAALVNESDSKTPIGIGAFNLVKADIFKNTPGFEWLKLEPGDDYGLGLMIKEAGGRTHFALADHDVSVPWYDSIKEMFKGLEKNMFGPGTHYSLVRMFLIVSMLWALLAAPGVALIVGSPAALAVVYDAGGRCNYYPCSYIPDLL